MKFGNRLVDATAHPLSVISLAVILLSPPLHAQTGLPPALVNPSTISFEHDGKNVTGFAAYIAGQNGRPVRIDLGSLRPDETGKIFARIPPLEQGTYTIEVVAYNETGESLRVVAEPSGFRIVVPRSIGAPQKSDRRAHADGRPVEPKPIRQSSAKDDEPGPKTTTPKVKKGIFGKLYSVIVGSDDEAPAK